MTLGEQRRTSAGILLYRLDPKGLEVLLAHPGGPFFRNRDDGSWTIPKGQVAPGESMEDAARREFREEIGIEPPEELDLLGTIKQRSGKSVVAFTAATERTQEWFTAHFAPGMFTMEWPPRSGRTAEFPEIDRIALFPIAEARRKIMRSQGELLEQLQRNLTGERGGK